MLRCAKQLWVVLAGLALLATPMTTQAQQRRSVHGSHAARARTTHARTAPRARPASETPEAAQIAKLLLDEARVADASRELYVEPAAPELAQNTALTFERARQYGRAARVLERYLEESPDAPDRDAVEARIAYLHRLDARRHVVRARHEIVRAAVVESDAAGRPSATRIAGFALVGGSAVAAIASYVTGLLADSEFSGLDAACAAGTCPPSLTDDMSRGSHLTTASRVLAGLAVASAGVGVVLVVVGGNAAPAEREPASARAERTPVRAQVEVVPGPIPTGIGARLRF